MRVFASFPEAERAVDTIAKSMKHTGEVPEVLVDAYRTSLSRTPYHGVVQHFFTKLAEKCPEAMKYFTGLKREEGK